MIALIVVGWAIAAAGILVINHGANVGARRHPRPYDDDPDIGLLDDWDYSTRG